MSQGLSQSKMNNCVWNNSGPPVNGEWFRSHTSKRMSLRAVSSISNSVLYMIVCHMDWVSRRWTIACETIAWHQSTVSTSIGCIQWLSLAKPALKVVPVLKVAHAGRNWSLVDCTSKCDDGWHIMCIQSHWTESVKYEMKPSSVDDSRRRRWSGTTYPRRRTHNEHLSECIVLGRETDLAMCRITDPLGVGNRWAIFRKVYRFTEIKFWRINHTDTCVILL